MLLDMTAAHPQPLDAAASTYTQTLTGENRMHTYRSRDKVRTARLIRALRRPRAGTRFRAPWSEELWPTLPPALAF